MKNLSAMLLGAALACAACGDDATTDAGGGSSTAGEAAPEAIALVRGALFTADLVKAQAYHDALASGGEEAAVAAGDIAHDTFLGTTLLGTPQGEFLAFDRWSSDAHMDAFYGDPGFQKAFAGLFLAPPPEFDTFLRAESFHGWGSLDAGDGAAPHYVIVVRGRFADEPSAMQAQHDGIAKGGESTAKGLGDVAHLIYVGRDDDREALLIDVWTTSDNLAAFYSDPKFQQAVGGLFEAPPRVAVYASSDWHQW